MAPVKKYLIYPGYVTSRNDGERHYISAGQLIRLYRVDPAECIIYDGRAEKLRGINVVDLINLFPVNSGVYEIPNSMRK